MHLDTAMGQCGQIRSVTIKVGEGVTGHYLIWASGMLPPKLRHKMGWLAFSTTTKNCQEMCPTPVKSLFEITMGNPFFDFFKYWPKRLTKIRIEIWTFSFQICCQMENTHPRTSLLYGVLFHWSFSGQCSSLTRLSGSYTVRMYQNTVLCFKYTNAVALSKSIYTESESMESMEM